MNQNELGQLSNKLNPEINNDPNHILKKEIED